MSSNVNRKTQDLELTYKLSKVAVSSDYTRSLMCLVKLFLTQCYLTHCIVRKPASGRPSKRTDAVLHAVEAEMQSNYPFKDRYYVNIVT